MGDMKQKKMKDQTNIREEKGDTTRHEAKVSYTTREGFLGEF
jgi:hypothetical protein